MEFISPIKGLYPKRYFDNNFLAPISCSGGSRGGLGGGQFLKKSGKIDKKSAKINKSNPLLRIPGSAPVITRSCVTCKNGHSLFKGVLAIRHIFSLVDMITNT